jgi:hypothetical protein
LDGISASSSYFRDERIKGWVCALWIMEKVTYNSLAVAIGVATGIYVGNFRFCCLGAGSTIYCTTSRKFKCHYK